MLKLEGYKFMFAVLFDKLGAISTIYTIASHIYTNVGLSILDMQLSTTAGVSQYGKASVIVCFNKSAISGFQRDKKKVTTF